MEYKEKYEMALERARVWKEKSGMPADKQGILDDIFPELAESEDEKIRKTLIRFFKDNYLNETEMYDGTVTVGKALAWLEKQGEKKPAKVIDKYEGLTDFERTLADICIGWIGEEIGWKEYIKDNANVLFKIAVEKFNSVQDVPFEQKSVWSEEDEEYINDLIGVFDGQQYQAHSDEEIVKWLKSIRLPYNKEWDENDEEMLRSIIATCELAEQDRDSSPARHLLEMQLDWLNSLKGKCTWKPSDEQMDALENAIRYGEEESIGILSLLYNDLKKLREDKL